MPNGSAPVELEPLFSTMAAMVSKPSMAGCFYINFTSILHLSHVGPSNVCFCVTIHLRYRKRDNTLDIVAVHSQASALDTS